MQSVEYVLSGHGVSTPFSLLVTRAKSNLQSFSAVLLFVLLVTASCNSARVSNAQATASASPCPPSWNRIPGTFSFEKFNEWHTGRAFAFACARDVAALPDADWRKLMDLFRAVAEANPHEWPPFRPCDGTSVPSPLASQANQRLGRTLLSDVCFNVTADVP